MSKRPNVVFVFSDQHRADAVGYAGNPDVISPNLDRLAKQSINFKTAVSNMPVCTPYRATLMTGQYPLTHGLFMNDKHLDVHRAVHIAEAFATAGYDTAYVGKWHINGKGRDKFIPKEERLGFEFWRVLECTHNYNQSMYYDETDQFCQWDGYDAQAQTACVQEYIRGRREEDKPFFLVLSWGPPHDPYHTVPEPYRELYDPECLTLRSNVPEGAERKAREHLSGYYAHVTALDSYVGRLLDTLREEGIQEDTIFIYTSDHGDMIGSQGQNLKQKPWDESILVPFLLRYPRRFGWFGCEMKMPFNSPDIMPTLLGLCGVSIPPTVEGKNYAPFLRGEERLDVEAALIQNVIPFGNWSRDKGGREYRGIRTARYTYARDIHGPWILYDNDQDPFQLSNRCGDPAYAVIQLQLDGLLNQMLKERGDEFLPGETYAEQWGYL